MEVPPIDKALILTTAGVFDRDRIGPPPSPLLMVGGLSLFLRTILTLQRAGITHFLVLGDDRMDKLRKEFETHPGITADARWLPTHEFPPYDPRTWEVLSRILGGSYLVAGTGAVFPVPLVARLRTEGHAGQPVVITRAPIRQEHSRPAASQKSGPEASAEAASSIAGTQRRSTAGEPGGVVTVEPATVPALNVDLVAIPEGFVSAAGWAGSPAGQPPLQTALERGLRRGQVKVLPLEPDWHQEVAGGNTGGTASLQEAEWTLLQSLKSKLDGYVDRYFNRQCSKWITRLLVRTPLTPNGITLLATAVGLLAAGVFAVGGYGAGIMGALLFQLSAILDCCDGEVARLKFLESPLGQRLDILLDNLVHVGLYLGIAWAASQGAWGTWALLLGGLAAAGNVLALIAVQKAMARRERLDPPRRRVVGSILDHLASRDFSVIILALALIGHLEWFLFLAAVGAHIFWPVLAWQLRPSRSAA